MVDMSAHGIPINVQKDINQLCLKLKRRELEGAHLIARMTVEVLRKVAEESKWSNAQELMDKVKFVGKLLADSQPLALVISNVVRRFLRIIRDEYKSHRSEKVVNPAETKRAPQQLHSPSVGMKEYADDASPSLRGTFSQRPDMNDFSKTADIKTEVMSSIQEWIEEFDHTYGNIEDQALEHIHADEVIMTFGKSETVMRFLKHAKKNGREFKVIVVEGAPKYEGHEVALFLSKLGIETTLVTDAAVFAMMARVNKVIVSCHAVMANGGLLSASGGHMLALAAKHHSVPLVVLCGVYKLTPLFPFNQDTFNILLSPADVLKYEEAECLKHATVVNPGYDYIPPDLVTLLITNRDDGQNPSYVYRMLSEYYSHEDYNLDLDEPEYV